MPGILKNTHGPAVAAPEVEADDIPPPQPEEQAFQLDDEHTVPQVEGGDTADKGAWGTVVVKNNPGKAKSHIQLTAHWNVPPEVIFTIFTYPDNSAMFRDVHAIGHRSVVVNQPGYKEVRVEQIHYLKILWMTRAYRTLLLSIEDQRDPECLSVTFELIRSDALAKFNGRWELRPVRDDKGVVTGCEVHLEQDVLPRGLPSFMQHMPFLGYLLRSMCLNSIRRMMDDMDAAIVKVKAGQAQGLSVLDVMRAECGVFEEPGHANGVVESYAVEPSAHTDDPSSRACSTTSASHNTPTPPLSSVDSNTAATGTDTSRTSTEHTSPAPPTAPPTAIMNEAAPSKKGKQQKEKKHGKQKDKAGEPVPA